MNSNGNGGRQLTLEETSRLARMSAHNFKAMLQPAASVTFEVIANAIDAHLAPREVTLREDSCDDVDTILSKLGLTVEQARTEGGNLRVQRICNHIQETLDALVQAHSFGVEMSDKYTALQADHQRGEVG